LSRRHSALLWKRGLCYASLVLAGGWIAGCGDKPARPNLDSENLATEPSGAAPSRSTPDNAAPVPAPATGGSGASGCSEPGCASPPLAPASEIASPPIDTAPPAVISATGECLSCARRQCATQFEAALGAQSTPENQADVQRLLACVVGPDWQRGSAIPASSCFFADPSQPRGSLVPCYCGATPVATCLAAGPSDPTAGCTAAVEAASRCTPPSPVCVTSSGADPSVPLGDVFQLLNCERAACERECGFPPLIVEE